MSSASSPLVNVFQRYANLCDLRNNNDNDFSSSQEEEWREMCFTLESIFSGIYRPAPADKLESKPMMNELRDHLPIEYLRVPANADVLCETSDSFFAGKLQDISTGGAYIHASVPFQTGSRVRLTFCTFTDNMPIEFEGRVAWHNPGGMRKRRFLEGAGLEFIECSEDRRTRLHDYICELVEQTLLQANLI